MGKRYIFLSLSGILFLLSFVVMFTKGFRWGIDFAGGVEVQISFQKPVPIGEIRTLLKENDFGDAVVQSYGEKEGYSYLVRTGRTKNEDEEKILTRMKEVFMEKYAPSGIRIDREDLVGPKVGKELRKKGFYSILFAMMGILIYIAFRFDFRYGLGAVLTLFHDPVIVLGLFSLMGKEMNLQIVAAILTLVGYSINDTIVVYDRVREEILKRPKESLIDTLNTAINLTLSRTVLTSGTTLLTMITLFFLTPPGSVIHDFAFTMIWGVVIGTYSSIYIASPVLLLLEKRRK